MNIGDVFERGGPIHVLLVDDARGDSALTAEALAAHDDIETTAVATPSEALDRIETSGVDCVVSEYAFENGDGLDFLRAVREFAPDLPFVLFTRHGSERVASEAIAAGVTDYLPKDSSTETFETLARRITNAVSDARQSNALEQLHSWYETVVEESHVGLYVVRKGRLEFVNDYLLNLLGYRAEDVINRPITDFIAEYDRHIVEERVSPQATAGIESTAYTADIVDRHGKPVALKVIGRRISMYGETVNVGVTTSAADHQVVERDIERSERTTRQIISSLPDMVFLSEPDEFDIVYINDAFQEIWGRPPSTLYRDSMSFLDLVHADDRTRLERSIEQIFRDIATDSAADRYEFEFRFTHEGDETTRWATARAVPLYDEDGTITNVLGVMTDLTERIRREQKLAQQNARLEAFARVLTHDIRGPLAVAQGRLGLVQETGESAHLEHVEHAHDRISEVIEDVLSLTRDERAVVELSAVPLSESAATAWSLCGTGTSDATVEIGELPVVEADQSKMKRLFENLFRNSVEHATPPSDSDLVIRVGSLPSNRGFFVEDNGQGISASVRDSLFTAGVSTKSKGESGLGLGIVRDIVHTHGWLIRTDESKSGGARFEIIFDTVGSDES